MIRMAEVRSSNVRAAGYDAEARALVVRFKGQRGDRPDAWYIYEGVGPGTYSDLLAAGSKGRFVAEKLAGNPQHPCRRLSDDEATALTG